MAHRALVAYERADGRFDVHVSRWGGQDCRLAASITPTEPFAGGGVDPEPRVVARPWESVRTMVDLSVHEMLYRVGTDYTVRTYLPLWFGLAHYLGESPTADAPEGLFVAVDSTGEAADLRRWLRAAKATLAEAVTGGYLTAEEAIDVLDRAARRRAGEREVIDPE